MEIKGLKEGYVQTNGIRMHYVFAGKGEPVVLLHGFPEHWYSWRYQIEALAEAGYMAVAPDLRGYGRTVKPRLAEGYRLPSLVGDIAGLAEGLGLERFTLVGHDWGGPIAWGSAMWLPQVTRLVVANGPHPGIYMRNLVSSRQFLQAWYIYVMQIPHLAERLLRRNDYQLIRLIFEDAARRAPETITDEDITRLTDEMRKPEAIECALTYYRQLFRANPLQTLRSLRKVKAPTAVIWGLKEKALVPDTQRKLERWVSGPVELHRIEDAGHFVPQERPQQVNEILIDFLAKHPQVDTATAASTS